MLQKPLVPQSFSFILSHLPLMPKSMPRLRPQLPDIWTQMYDYPRVVVLSTNILPVTPATWPPTFNGLTTPNLLDETLSVDDLI